MQSGTPMPIRVSHQGRVEEMPLDPEELLRIVTKNGVRSAECYNEEVAALFSHLFGMGLAGSVKRDTAMKKQKHCCSNGGDRVQWEGV